MRGIFAFASVLALAPAVRAQDAVPRDPIQMEQERRIQGWGFEQSVRQNPQLYPFAPSAPTVPAPVPPSPTLAPLAKAPTAPIPPDPTLTTHHRPRQARENAAPEKPSSNGTPQSTTEHEVHP